MYKGEITNVTLISLKVKFTSIFINEFQQGDIRSIYLNKYRSDRKIT